MIALRSLSFIRFSFQFLKIDNREVYDISQRLNSPIMNPFITDSRSKEFLYKHKDVLSLTYAMQDLIRIVWMIGRL